MYLQIFQTTLVGTDTALRDLLLQRCSLDTMIDKYGADLCDNAILRNIKMKILMNPGTVCMISILIILL